MKVEHTDLPGLFVVHPVLAHDSRGWFARTFDRSLFRDLGFDGDVVQENQSRSRRDAVRGLHVRSDLAEAKTVRVLRGAVLDVVVDLRPGSPTFLQHQAIDLVAEFPAVLVVPPGCAHGFLSRQENTDVLYQVTAPYQPELDITIAWDDPQLAIPWPVNRPWLSERDRHAPRLASLEPRLWDWFGSWTTSS